MFFIQSCIIPLKRETKPSLIVGTKCTKPSLTVDTKCTKPSLTVGTKCTELTEQRAVYNLC